MLHVLDLCRNAQIGDLIDVTTAIISIEFLIDQNKINRIVKRLCVCVFFLTINLLIDFLQTCYIVKW